YARRREQAFDRRRGCDNHRALADANEEAPMWPKTHTSVVFLSALYVAAVTASAAMKQLTVATDGSGDFKTVQEAVDAAPSDNTEHVLIRIKPGRYKGKLVVPKNKPMVALIGDDAMTTVLTNDWNAKHLGPD